MHEEILKMIEEVDPTNTKKLDEINARVWCFLNGHVFSAAKWDRILTLDKNQCEIEIFKGICTLRYTKSRDTLKAIRPDGWWFPLEHKHHNLVWFYIGMARKAGQCLFPITPELPTEELAELHAIIQAIAYERKGWVSDVSPV